MSRILSLCIAAVFAFDASMPTVRGKKLKIGFLAPRTGIFNLAWNR